MANPKPLYLYKVLTLSEWAHVQMHSFSHEYTTALDKQDGFIHLSTKKQTLQRWQDKFKDKNNGVILKLDYQQMQRQVRWEPNNNGELYPHFYGKMNMNFVRELIEIDPKRMPRL